jgi:hypothetical protein
MRERAGRGPEPGGDVGGFACPPVRQAGEGHRAPVQARDVGADVPVVLVQVAQQAAGLGPDRGCLLVPFAAAVVADAPAQVCGDPGPPLEVMDRDERVVAGPAAGAAVAAQLERDV